MIIYTPADYFGKDDKDAFVDSIDDFTLLKARKITTWITLTISTIMNIHIPTMMLVMMMMMMMMMMTIMMTMMMMMTMLMLMAMMTRMMKKFIFFWHLSIERPGHLWYWIA